MNFKARQLSLPECVFGDGSQANADERYKALRRRRPFDNSEVVSNPTILFVFPDEYQVSANKLFKALKNGNNQFPGIESLFGVPLANSSVRRVSNRFSVSGMSASEAALRYEAAIQDQLSKDSNIDFAIVICDKTPRFDFKTPYYASKINLAASGVASQIVTLDLLKNESQLDWSLANIALQIFVKLGGHPWFVKPSPGGGDIVIGIGRSEREHSNGSKSRFVGFTTCYTSGGLFKSVEIFKPQRGMSDYLDALQGSIEGALQTVISQDADPVRFLVLHVSKKFGRSEHERLEAALKSVESKIAIQYVVLRVTEDHPFVALDRSHSSFAPQSGLSIELDTKDRLLVLEGRPAYGDMRKPASSPLWVTLQQSNTGDTTLDALVQQIYELSVANWRGFNARAKPITIHYSELVADILSASENDAMSFDYKVDFDYKLLKADYKRLL